MEFEKFRFDDGCIKGIRVLDDSVEVDCISWQEKPFTLRFGDAIACLVLSAHDKPLSHGTVQTDGSFLRECCEASEEDGTKGFCVFNFISVWTGMPLMRVVARGVEMMTEPVI